MADLVRDLVYEETGRSRGLSQASGLETESLMAVGETSGPKARTSPLVRLLVKDQRGPPDMSEIVPRAIILISSVEEGLLNDPRSASSQLDARNGKAMPQISQSKEHNMSWWSGNLSYHSRDCSAVLALQGQSSTVGRYVVWTVCYTLGKWLFLVITQPV